MHGLFDREESLLIDRALAAVERKAPSDAALLRHQIDQLATLVAVLSAERRLDRPTQLAGEQRDRQTLLDHLCHLDGLSGDLVLPLKAILSRTFLLSKIMFLRGFVKATSALAEEGAEYPLLSHQLREEMAQSIYTQLAEELLMALLRKPDVHQRIKRRAAGQLVAVWDNAQIEIDDFCPLLESAWHARNRITSGYGCLLGTTEYFRLVCEDCPPQFLNFFARDEMSLAEGQAFEEFLFNMTFEELSTLREGMREQSLDVVSPEWASQILGRQIDALDDSGEIDPMALYRSYYRRQLAADYRIIAGSKGPRRTAEAYLMIFLLDQQADPLS
ncbi:hypothetical protein [Haliangium ochraceum]|uniref:Uncharacterized protein n=1 Tax=Haliangium ochraceum (strain DSM 14365 / JCM 11303 / SMP-2) TaxID=502025 RepID=D0LGJ9_HALO1|nr:hypothetical protein [Haliangium ochraceum]ACY12745.1 hypothetical protein Hoch_0104 [Haliangium ochraceum DSM 14365]